MIFGFDNPNEYIKFAKLHDKARYACFKSKLHGFYVLRPLKTSRNLDTALYTGIKSKDLDEFLENTYEIMIVKEITVMTD